MLDLNHILLFLACISPLVLLAQTRRTGGLYRAWRLASFVVLLVTGISWMIARDMAGFVGAGAWLTLLVVPAIGLRKIAEFGGAQRYAAARRLARALLFLHPAGALRAQAELFHALELAQRGDYPRALALLAPLRNNYTNVGRQATAQSFRLRAEWMQLAEWVRSELPPPIRRNDFCLMPLYLRALGETGARDELLLECATMLTSPSAAQLPAWSYHSSMLVALAFCGRLHVHANLRKFRKLPQDWREFWLGTSELAAGEISAGRARLEKLQAKTNDRLLRPEITQRLSTAGRLAEAPLSPPSFALLHRLEQSERPPTSAFPSETIRPTTAVSVLIALNIAMFLAEVAMGGATNPETLHRLGALEPWAVLYGREYWRLLSALFLHYGPLHLIFNLYALFVIGPGLERAIGPLRFAAYYLVSGLGSSLGVLLLRFSEFSAPEQLVGASGCVMGIVGVWAGFLLRHRHQPLAGRRLKNIVLIVAVQSAFDLFTPQVSMAAHLSGFATGLGLGLLVSPVAAVYDRRPIERRTTRRS